MYPEDKALKVWTVDDLTLSIVRHPSLGHLCGYVRFSKRPLVEDGYNGIATYVPVHGGITYASQFEDDSFVYGFDCGHYDDAPPVEYQREYYYEHGGHVWTEEEVITETEKMAHAIKVAAEFEEAYLLASDSQTKADVLDKYVEALGTTHNLNDNFGAQIRLLSGEL